jgi:hypothetical protein
MSATINTNTASNATLFKMAANISQIMGDSEGTDANDKLLKAMEIAKEFAKPENLALLGLDARSLESQGSLSKKGKKKEKKVGPKKGKNAYMFFLAHNRAAIKSELENAKANPGSEFSADIKELFADPGCGADASDPDKKVTVAAVTKIAGKRWGNLSPEEKSPFEKMAADDTAAKKAEFEASQNNGEASA